MLVPSFPEAGYTAFLDMVLLFVVFTREERVVLSGRVQRQRIISSHVVAFVSFSQMTSHMIPQIQG